jgi:hypothetical protein
MYLINDLVNFRGKTGLYRVSGVDDENRESPRYKITDEASSVIWITVEDTEREYSFWVDESDLKYIPEPLD